MNSTDPIWSGTWVTERLGVRLVDAAPPPTDPPTAGTDPQAGPMLADLVGLAVRRNPRRAHLVVSEVLGKHVPVDPRIIYTAGWLLGRRVAELLGAEITDHDLPGDWLAGRPAGIPPAGVAHLARPPLVVGYAETATALGHVVADVFAGADYLHSTRRPVPGVALLGRFDESHSHATEHLLLPAEADWLDRDGPLVLADDELTTGRTAAATIRALHAVRPRDHYVLATLVDLRAGADRRWLDDLGTELGARVDVVSLATGEVALPDDVLDRGRALVAEFDRPPAPPDPTAAVAGTLAANGAVVPAARSAPPAVRRVEAPWPGGVPEGGRHGFAARHRSAFDEAIGQLAAAVGAGLPATARVLVLGTEEFMAAPLALACRLAQAHDGPVRFSSTTRSPVLAVDAPGYAIRTRLTFAAHDAFAGPTETRYAYNVAPPAGDAPYDRIVLVVDRTADTPRLGQDDGLLPALAAVSAGVTVAVVPDLVPAMAGTGPEETP